MRTSAGMLLLFLLPLFALMLMLPLIIFAPSGWFSSPDERVLLLVDDTWQELPQPALDPVELQMSDSGVIWASTSEGVMRYTGDAWEYFGSETIGTDDSYMGSGYRVVGDDLWGAAGNAVVHYDGQQWHVHNDVLPEPYATVATEQDVWAVNTVGDLAHYDGTTWTNFDLREQLPEINWSNSPDHYTVWPYLVPVPDGTVWLEVEDRLWRFDGSTWTDMTPPELANSDYLGILEAAPEQLWISDGAALFQVRHADGSATRTPLAEMGLPADAWMRDVAERGADIWVVTEEHGLAHFDGSTWRTLPPPPPDIGVASMDDLVIAPDGTVVLIGQPPFNSGMSPFSLLMFGVIIVSMIPGVWFAQRAKKHQQAEQERVQEVLTDKGLTANTNAPAKDSDSQTLLQSPFVFAGFMVAVMFVIVDPFGWFTVVFWHIGTLLQPVIPGMSAQSIQSLVPLLIVPLVLLGMEVWKHIQKRRSATDMSQRISRVEAQTPEEDQTEQKTLWQILSPHLTTIVITVGMLIAIPLVMPSIGNAFAAVPWPAWLTNALSSIDVLIGLLVAMLFLSFLPIPVIIFWPFLKVYLPLRRGDYQTTMQRLDAKLAKNADDPQALSLKSATLCYMGQFPAAEEQARTLLSKIEKDTSEASSHSIALTSLGEALRGQGRYAEAQTTLESAIELSEFAPTLVGCYFDLAEVYLYQEIEPARAQELLEEARRRHRKRNVFMRWFEREAEMYIEGDLAWAHALQGNHAEAEAALEHAFQKADRGFRPAMAGLHLRASYAYRALGNKQRAREHFREAQQFDPVGYYGTQAREAERW